MGEVEELRFVCKLCDKKYPCGKSLGGHMRSHSIANSAQSEAKLEANKKKNYSDEKESRVEFIGLSGYGLRENPKKTWRIVNSNHPLPQDKVCKQCGKGFQSVKALCGHMACHSEKERGLKDDHSWTSENQKQVVDYQSDTESEDPKPRKKSESKRYKRIVVKSSSVSLGNGCSSFVSEIDEQEQEELAMCLMMLSKDSGNWGVVNSVVESSDNNSVVLETKPSPIDTKFDRKRGFNSVYKVDETLEMKKLGGKKLKSSVLDSNQISEFEKSDSGYFVNEAKTVELGISVDGVLKNGEFKKLKVNSAAKFENPGAKLKKTLIQEKGYNDAGIASKPMKYDSQKRIKDDFYGPESSDAKICKNSKKRRKYECLTCKKTFNSFQAFGGHRPCHKRSNSSFASRYETNENTIDGDISPRFVLNSTIGECLSYKKPVAKDKRSRPKKINGHECPFCGKIFKSGQALGGHKRSHFMGGNRESSNQTLVMKQEFPDLLDLNLPAPMEDEADGNVAFLPW